MTSTQQTMTLDRAVGEVLNLLTGLDLHYIPELDRYRSIVHHINRALRSVAMDSEWSCYADTLDLGHLAVHARSVPLGVDYRPRITGDDAVRLVDSQGDPVVWAYMLPRDALHKYRRKGGLWAAVLRDRLLFSRPLAEWERELTVQLSVMRDPRTLVAPAPRENIESLESPGYPAPELVQRRNMLLPEVVEEWNATPGNEQYLSHDPEAGLRQTQADTEFIRHQEIDFFYPDLIVLKAAYFYAQSDPVMQPRVQTLEKQYKDMMYQVIERDTSFTESPYLNDFILPVQGSLYPEPRSNHGHPHSDWRN